MKNTLIQSAHILIKIYNYCCSLIIGIKYVLEGGRLRFLFTAARCYRMLERLPEIYHPIPLPGFDDLQPKRKCDDRVKMILDDMDNESATVLDVGCQIGYFSFMLAEKGYTVSSFDMLKKNIDICLLINKLRHKKPSPDFFIAKLTLESIEQLTKVDYVICLAVFHHIIYYEGFDIAKKLMCRLRKKISKKMYFEIGQSNEPVEPWASSLPDMGEKPIIWISDFLREAGFEHIKLLGMISTHVSEVKRCLVAAW